MIKHTFKWTSYLLLVLLGGAFIFGLFQRAYYIPDKAMFQPTTLIEMLIFIAIILMLIVVIYLTIGIKFYTGLCISIGLTVVIQLVFILFYPLEPFSDMGSIYNIALGFERGALYSAFEKGQYLATFPNNMYYALFLSLVYKVFPDIIIVGKIINIISSLVVIYSTGRLYKEFFGEKHSGALLVLLSVYPPFILYSNHMYNDIISIAFFTSATLMLILGINKKNIYYVTIGFLLLIMGDLLRQIGIVFLITFCLFLLINGRRVFSKKTVFIVITASLAGYLFTKPAIEFLLVTLSVIPSNFKEYNMPILAWLHIGFDFSTLGFQNGGRSFSIFNNLDYNKKLASEVYQHDLIVNFKDNGFMSTIKFLVKKYLWTWTEGTYQMDRYGFGNNNSIQYETYLTKVINSYPQLRNVLTLITHYYNTVILGFASVGIYLICKKKYYDSLIFIIIILGTIGFYCLWEIKSRYIFIVFPYLFIYFYYGITSIISHYFNTKNSISR